MKINVVPLLVIVALSLSASCTARLTYAQGEESQPREGITVDAYGATIGGKPEESYFLFDVYGEDLHGVAGVTIKVFYEDGTLYAVEQTNVEGTVRFYGVPAGTYLWEAYWEQGKIASGTLESRSPRMEVYAFSAVRDGQLDDDDFAFSVTVEGVRPVSNATVKVYNVDGFLCASDNTNEEGLVDFVDIPPGEYTWEAYYNNAKVDSGTVRSSGQFEQAVSILSPAGGSVVSGTIPVRVSINGHVYVGRVEFYVDASKEHTIIPELETTSEYEWSWDTIRCSDGQHTIKAIVYDLGGNEAADEIMIAVANVEGGFPSWLWPVIGVAVAVITGTIVFIRRRPQKHAQLSTK